MGLREELEIKVGIFVLVGVIILSVIVFSIGDIKILKRGYTIKLRFNDISGLEAGAPVNLLGVKIGEVKSIDFIYNGRLKRMQVELLLWIEEGTKIGEDTTAKVKRLGLMGEKYVDLAPGKPEVRFLEKGNILYGQDPISIEDVTEEIYLASNEIKKAVFYINDILGDKKVRDDFKQSVKSAKEITERLDAIVSRIEKSEGTIGLLISDDKVYRNLEAFTADIKKHPWKLLIRTREKSQDENKEKKRGFIIQKGPQ